MNELLTLSLTLINFYTCRLAVNDFFASYLTEIDFVVRQFENQ